MDFDELSLVVLDESQITQTRHSKYPKTDPLAAFAKKTFRSLKKSNQRIDTFCLRLESEWYGLSGLAATWTSKALKMGAADLTFLFNNINTHPPIFIPFDEVFGSEHVITLRLDTVKVYQRLNVIKCSGLQSLTLKGVSLKSDSFYNIVSCCPSIEYLSLSYVYDGSDGGGGIPEGSTISLPKLTTLVLSNVSEYGVQNLFLGPDSSSKFPNLKVLTLCLSSSKGKEYFISIHSLEILNFSADDYECLVEFDVPCIRKFTFEDKSIPNVSFRSTKSTDQWEESHVRLTNDGELNAKWFWELSNFLKELRRSEIYLCLHLRYKVSFDYEAGEVEVSDLVELEDLIMDTEGLPCLSFNALLDGLFRICRPNMISQYVIPPNRNDMFLCRALSERAGRKSKRLLIVSEFMVSLLDLEKVSCEELDDDGVWRPQRLSMLLEDSRRMLHLKWKPSKLASITA